MTFDVVVVLLVFLLAILLFATERLRVDLVALLVLALLLATGTLSAAQGIAGFSNPATVTVAAMMVLSGGLTRTGALTPVASALGRLAERSFALASGALLVVVAGVSAFVNNTAAVAIFLPIVLRMARVADASPSKLLMPLSFAGILGGTCTLVGTSTNILIDTIATEHGQPSFGMFEFAPLGLVILVAGLAYLSTLGARLLPARRRPRELTRDFDLADYVAEIELPEGSPLVERTIGEVGLDVLSLLRGGDRRSLPPEDVVLRAGDRLRVRGGAADVAQLRRREGVELRPLGELHDRDLEGDAALVEVVVPASSPVVGETAGDVEIPRSFGAALLAVRHRGEILHEGLDRTRLRPGDLLLLDVPRARLETLRGSRALLLVSEQDAPTKPSRTLRALSIVAAVVATAALGILPIVSAALVGCVAMVLARCLSMRHAYESVDWQVIFLLAGMLGLGSAMEETGAAQLASSGIVRAVGPFGPVAIISAFYLVTALLTAVMSNQATAVLLAPIAVSTAGSLGFDARPLLMAVAYGASACFLTPVGYQTNTLVYGPGQYRFADFVRVGAPLVVLSWILATALIPVLWPPQ